MLTDETYNDPTHLSFISFPSLYSSLISLLLVLSFLISLFIHSVCLSLPLSLFFSPSLSFSLFLVCSRGSICLVYTLYVHLPTAKTTPRTKPKQCCQTSVRRVAWPFAFRLCCDTEYFANAFYRGIFGPLVKWQRQAPTLFA